MDEYNIKQFTFDVDANILNLIYYYYTSYYALYSLLYGINTLLLLLLFNGAQRWSIQCMVLRGDGLRWFWQSTDELQ
jgi:hypothetical protein